ncbi:collagenase-like protease [Nitzschia inconspicua]|uniref:Collagenase-like protease n=1 Tax=Nitzschia inconspicua TaxID=303405 RepID=A0A9K3PN22_9STRA|nr:collagenase-like protease [Nitzschia inconspicua]
MARRDDLSPDEHDHVTSQPNEKKRILSSPPEVMAPVGGFPQLHAAIGNGADSVYLGLSAYSARARATNFDPETELPEAVKIAHDANVKVYVALNTLVFDNELEEVENLIKHCIAACVDALIVQDLGVARLAQTIIKRTKSNMDVHASTQQTITSADGAAFCEEVFDTTRVVLSRELSISEIDAVSSQLENEHPNVELEAFVHGALCVSYSGQCFSSEAWGGRSANRGQCAQACRLPYGLIDNGELKELGDFSYLLSPQDLCGLDQVPKLIEANVRCLKIEGRLKDEAYVAATTRAYRNAVDEAWKAYCSKHGLSQIASQRRNLATEEQVSKKELAQVFSRGQDENFDGLTPGFFEGSKHQQLVRGRSPRHRGVHVGRVMDGSSWKNGLILRLDNDDVELKLGDGLVIDRGLAQEEELGGTVFDLFTKNGPTTIHFSKDVERKWRRFDDNARKGFGSGTSLAPAGAHVWKTSDAAVDKKMRRLSKTMPPRFCVKVAIAGRIGEPLQVTITDQTGRVGQGVSDGNLERAEQSGLSRESVRRAIGTLGDTRWSIDEDIDTAKLEQNVWCPVAWIKDARRKAVLDLEAQQADNNGKSKAAVSYDDSSVTEEYIKSIRDRSADKEISSVTYKLTVLARTINQVETLCRLVENGEAIDEIIVDFLEVDGMKDAVSRIRRANVRAAIAAPRVIKPNESGIWRTLLRLEPDSLLVRSTGLLHRMMKFGGPGASVVLIDGSEEKKVNVPQLVGDFSLNVANALTAYEFLEYGCERVTVSYDLGAHAISEMLQALGPRFASRIEIVAHCHMPIFHTEHCIFARFLSNGNSYLDCGHACTRHDVHLRDETGKDNPVLADIGCRNTVFSAEAQSGAHSLKEWMDAGANHFRIELVDESAEDAQKVVLGYLAVLEGKQKVGVLWETLSQVEDSNGRMGGVSIGSFRNAAERRAGEII